MMRAVRFVLVAVVVAGLELACRRPPPIEEADPNVAPILVDSGPEFVPNQHDLDTLGPLPPRDDAGRIIRPPSPSDGFASDAGPGFHLLLSESHFSLGSHDGWADSVSIEDDGTFFAEVKNGCVKGSIGKAGVAKLIAALGADAYFDPPNYFVGPTDSGSTRMRVRSGGRDKMLNFRGPLLEPISPGVVIGTFTRQADGGFALDDTQHEVDTTVADLARRKQIAALLKTVKAVTALGSRPVVKCPADADSRFEDL